MKRHPFLLGLLLLCLVGVAAALVFYGAALLMGKFGILTGSDKIAVIAVEGMVTDSRDVIEHIRQVEEDDGFRAVVVRINSPGGPVVPYQEIYEALKNLKKKKKVVVSMGSVAASGGYLIACAADRIVANPGTLTGSLSAIIHFANAEELLRKIGLKTSVIKSGRYKDIGSPAREMTAEERSLFQALVDDIYDQLLETISRDRKIAKEELRKIADGRVFTGRQAKDVKLVDELGDLTQAVAVAARLAGVAGKPEVVTVAKKKSRLWNYLVDEGLRSLLHDLDQRSQDATGPYYLHRF